VPPKRTTRAHAARVAAVATLVVMAVYVVAVFVLNLVVDNRLTHDADVRLADRLAHLAPSDLTARSATHGANGEKRGGDADDTPTFVWVVDPAGSGRALQPASPRLPRRRWTSGPLTLDVGSTPFRFQAGRVGGHRVVVGESLAEVTRFQDAVQEPEVLLGLVLLAAVFAGALVIGLRASAPVEEVRRRQAEFTADASHELRTPLSVIEAEVDLALSRPRDATFLHATLERIGAEGRRLRRIVDDLLWLARTDATSAHPGAPGPVDIAAIARECTERFRAVAERRRIAMSFAREGPDRSAVLARPEDVDRLTGVLVDNACKHAGAGGRIEVRVRASGARVILSVDDSGAGIPEDQVPLIFDRFHRASATGSGTGLGLAIADAIVRSTRGSWTVGRSALGGAHLAVSWRRATRHPLVGPSGRRPVRGGGDRLGVDPQVDGLREQPEAAL
jgi:signal transduction histidine kinase